MYDMLRPGARLALRVKRNGNIRNLTVNVLRRPGAEAGTWIVQHSNSNPDIAEEVRREVERANAEALRETERAGRELAREQARAQREIQREALRSQRELENAERELNRRASVSPILAGSGVAGAQVAPLNDDLAEVFGVRRGVFVVSVSSNTPADRMGLRGGDVITAVGDSVVADISQLRRAIQREQRRARDNGSERATRFQIVRKNRRQKLTLRW
jgi:C-terminal processing protease CtpA/Prc